MISETLFLVGGIIIFSLIALLVGCASQKRRNDKERRRWQNEYWILRNSEAIREDYKIHLSWFPYGENECIKPKTVEEE